MDWATKYKAVETEEIWVGSASDGIGKEASGKQDASEGGEKVRRS